MHLAKQIQVHFEHSVYTFVVLVYAPGQRENSLTISSAIFHLPHFPPLTSVLSEKFIRCLHKLVFASFNCLPKNNGVQYCLVVWCCATRILLLHIDIGRECGLSFDDIRRQVCAMCIHSQLPGVCVRMYVRIKFLSFLASNRNSHRLNVCEHCCRWLPAFAVTGGIHF